MPLSGPSGEEGKKLAELIKWGLEDNLKGFVSTTTYDVSTEEFTKQAAEKLLAKRTQIILGPLFTPSVKALEKLARNNGIIMLTLSNNPMLGDESHIYVFGHAPLKQTNRMLGYLFENGHKDFALLLPSNKGSINLKKVYDESIAAKAGNVISSQNYSPDHESIAEAVSKISTAVDEAIESVDAESKPVIIIAEENPELLREIYRAIKLKNLDNKALVVGDGRIDVGFSKPINYLFTGASRELDAKLQERCQTILGISHLSMLQNLAYDLGAVTSTAIGLSYSKETFLNRLKSPVWYNGLSGEVRFNGPLAERKYSIIEHAGNSYRVKDSAVKPPVATK